METSMNPSETVESLFEAARQLPTSKERAAYLQTACGQDMALRQRVEALLKAEMEAGEFLSAPLPTLQAESASRGTTVEPLAEKPGDRIGRYKLLQQIGEGGCGVVYMAEQEEPVRRRVALKVIKPGMDSRQVLARFEAERQALALMDHPNIARVLDAGATGNGRPFFVMELVKGVRITDYCDQAQLATPQRLELFVQVCLAIQHAHQKGIIHRDIKPSNVLVTLHDGVPIPKVIDFGIAKATTGQQLTDKTLFTAFEQFVGTPAYMSPEQVKLSGLDVDTRSDIYSLGVLLYELLTGKTPFDAKELLAAGLEQMRRTIREKDPVRPSTRLSTMLAGELTVTARHRQCEALRLIALLRGDLDWIVMKTLEKDRSRRYETANGLAMDLRRYLADEPVLARPPSRTYRLQKLIRRNKLVFGAAGAAIASLMIGLIISGLSMISEKKQRHIAEEQRNRATLAQTAAQTAQQLADKRAGQLLSALRLFRSGVTNLSDAEAFFHDTIETQRKSAGSNAVELASSLQYLAMIQDIEQKEPQAAATLREALVLQKKTLREGDPEIVETTVQLAMILQSLDKPEEAEPVFRDALKQLRIAAAKNPAHLSHYFGVALHHLAEVLRKEKKLSEAVPLAQEAIAKYERHPEWPLGEHAHAQHVLADVLQESENSADGQSLNRMRQGQRLLAEGEYLASRAEWDQAAAKLTEATRLDPANHATWWLLGSVLAGKGDVAAYQKDCHEIFERFGNPESPMIAERTAKVCSILPAALPVDDLAKVARLAEWAAEQGADSPWVHWFQVTRGLAEYRQGNFTNALTSAKEAQTTILHSQDQERWVCEILSYLVCSLAQSQLHQPAEARGALDHALQIARQHGMPQANNVELGQFWHDVVIAQLLAREAQGLLDHSAPSKPQ
jgi:serine/threonine protein kinase